MNSRLLNHKYIDAISAAIAWMEISQRYMNLSESEKAQECLIRAKVNLKETIKEVRNSLKGGEKND